MDKICKNCDECSDKIGFYGRCGYTGKQVPLKQKGCADFEEATQAEESEDDTQYV